MATGVTEKSVSTLVPDYPSERPTRKAFDDWQDKASTVLTQQGYGCLMRGEVPYELRKLAPRPLLPVPAEAAAAAKVNSKNDDIDWQKGVHLKLCMHVTIMLIVHNLLPCTL